MDFSRYKSLAPITCARVLRKNRLRESLGIFINLHEARTINLWRLEMKQKFSQLMPLEILYVRISACKPKSEKKPFFKGGNYSTI